MATDPAPPVDGPVPTEIWDREHDDELLCVDVHEETHDVKTFTFVAPTGKRFAFAAGQYFLFELPIRGETHDRCYSIASSPLRMNAISVTVKRVAGGTVSNWLHDTLAPGARVKASGPLGEFTRPAAAKYLFLSGGSGITPLMSMARDLDGRAEGTDVVFLHAGRTPRDLVFREELACIATRLKGFRLHFLPETLTGEPSWPGLTGRISPAFLSLAVPDIAERVVMCCGPAPFMAAACAIVTELGVPPARYFEESFDAAVIEEAPAAVADAVAARTFAVTFAKQSRTVEVATDQTVLAAAKKAGIKLPSSCANGLCGTCKSKLASGSVDMKHGGGIRQREIDAGFFLPCCSRPLSDLVIER